MELSTRMAKDEFSLTEPIKIVMLLAGIYFFPRLVRLLAESLGQSWLAARPISNGLGMLLSVLVAFLIPPRRGVGSSKLKYLFLGLTGSILFFGFSLLFLDNRGNYVGHLPFGLALALLSLIFTSVAWCIFWNEVDQRKRLGLLLAFNLILVVALFFLILQN